jgi:hypothetical protein
LLNHDVFFIFFSKRLSWSYNPGHGSLNIGFSFYWVILVSWPEGHEFVTLPRIHVFRWELGFMICFNLLFIRLSWSHNLEIVLNGLTHIDFTHFYVIFLIKTFTNSIIQHRVWQRWLRIELHNLFWFALYGVISVLWPKSRIW